MYLNGIGLPCSTHREVLESNRHWLNRVWTVQEAVERRWLPGGLTAGSVATKFPSTTSGSATIWALTAETASIPGPAEYRIKFPDNFADRHCTNALDRVAVMGYCLHKACNSTPVYDPQMSPDQAWAELLKHMRPHLLTSIFLQKVADKPFSPWPSLATFMRNILATPWSYEFRHPHELLSLAPRRESASAPLAECRPGEYGHSVRTIGPYHVSRVAGDDVGFGQAHQERLRFRASNASWTFELCNCRSTGVLLCGVPYTLAQITFGSSLPDAWRGAWVAVEAFETNETRDGRPVVRAVKWGIVEYDFRLSDTPDPLALAYGARDAYVVYMNADEARQRSAYAKLYSEAFEEMRTSDREYTFGQSLSVSATAHGAAHGGACRSRL